MLLIAVLGPALTYAILPAHEEDPDRGLYSNVSTLSIQPNIKLGLVIVLTPVLCASVIVVISAARRYRPIAYDLRIALPVLVAATYSVLTYWSMGAPVSGANMGAGFLFLLGCVLVPGLVFVAVLLWLRGRGDREVSQS